MKKLAKLALSLVAAVGVFFGVQNVFAATTTISANNNSTQTWTITRHVNDVTNPVTATFGYTITADADNPATVNLSSVTPTVVFNAVSPTNGTATQTGILDMSSVVFSEVGDYEFVVSETSVTPTGAYPLDTDVYHIFVSVRYEVDANNVPDNDTLVATLVEQAYKNDNTSAQGKEAIVFESSPSRTAIEISKGVTGNLASTSEYFKVLVDIAGGTNGDTYAISGQSYTGTGVQTVYTVGQTNYVWLKHGETITIGKVTVNGKEIYQVPIGVNYTLTEQDATDYDTYIDGSTTTAKATTGKQTAELDYNSQTQVYSIPDENKTAFVNNKEADVITGIFINIFPFIVLVALAAAGVYAIRKSAQARE